MIPWTNPHFGHIVHISVRMRLLFISTLDDYVVVVGRLEEAQFFEL